MNESPTQLPSETPPELNYITKPLSMALIFHAINMLFVPFSSELIGEQIITSAQLVQEITGENVESALKYSPEYIRTVMWLLVFIHGIAIVWIYYTRHGILERLTWARYSTIVLACLFFLNFPFLTILSIFIFIGLGNKKVRHFLAQQPNSQQEQLNDRKAENEK